MLQIHFEMRSLRAILLLFLPVIDQKHGASVFGLGLGSVTSNRTTVSVPQCQEWLASIRKYDSDNSNGLNSSEYYQFLRDAEALPLDMSEFFRSGRFNSFSELPWHVKVLHKSLACRCADLGLGNDCCKGPDVEVTLLGLTDDFSIGDKLALEYRVDICNQIAFTFDEVRSQIRDQTTEYFDSIETSLEPDELDEIDKNPAYNIYELDPGTPIEINIIGSVLDYTKFSHELAIFGQQMDVSSVPNFISAHDVTSNADGNNVRAQVSTCIGELAKEQLGKVVIRKRRRRPRGGRYLRNNQVKVENIGFGNPGSGIDYTKSATAVDDGNSTDSASIAENDPTLKATDVTDNKQGLPMGAVIGIAGAAAVLVVGLAVCVILFRRRKRRMKIESK
ncbi:hypothetical protein THAOC_27912 [Thalassiosira oceanica]|uniref:Calmodulin n=1 Tax=Thalassiosira oceanica TaxID=159749 RepID=K0RVD2_THAOC|nr:hypothetical protein THAOC_27912 [Thalassiosira oceanica]|eukprot:EJK52781.1 hypothetical protein THAOC_27912 [Thalassiosira oceanica]